MKALTAEQVLRLHREVLTRFWGDPGLRDRGLLESALARPFAAYGGVEAHPEVHQKAAALWHALVVNHPFVDANRPVALAAVLIFLRVNGFSLELAGDELVKLTNRLVEERLAAVALAAELAESIR